MSAHATTMPAVEAANPLQAAPLALANQNLSVPELKTNILVVDDRPDKLLALEAILAPLGQNLIQARSGKEALRRLLQQDFSVILLDVSMPGMDGFETASLIRQRQSSELTPIIFVTSLGISENHIAHGYSIGAVDYLLSPIVPQILRTKVSIFVELYKKTELIKRQAEQLRLNEEHRHQREMAEAVDRLDMETRRNRFFTLAPDMLGIAGFDGRLMQLNPSWTSILGYAHDELKAASTFDLVHPEDLPDMIKSMDVVQNGSSIIQFEGRFLHKDRSYRWLQWVAAPFPAESLVYIFARDITARKQTEEQIRSLNQQLQQKVSALTEANLELEAFNYSIAHDLRTPLRSMSGFSQALIEDETANLSPLGLGYARRVAQSAKYMDALLLDLLAYSRLTRADVSPVEIALDEPVLELVTLLEKEIRDKKAKVEVLSPLGAVYANLPTLKQIISNLIGNSLKFVASERPPLVRVYTTHDGPLVRLWVEDNGIGIAPEHHDKIFQLFQRLHDSQLYPGTGVGLALVRKGAERMGGRAGVESDPGKGSRFWVDLPAASATAHGN